MANKTVVQLRRGRHLEVKETKAEVRALITASTDGFIDVHQVKSETLWKSPTPIDTKANKVLTEVEHSLNVSEIVDLVELAEYEAGVRGVNNAF